MSYERNDGSAKHDKPSPQLAPISDEDLKGLRPEELIAMAMMGAPADLRDTSSDESDE
jgi:hypothetical protein